MISPMRQHRVTLKRLEVGIASRISPHMLNAHVEVLCSAVADEFEVRARGFVWAEDKAAREYHYKHPKTWWQGFKDACYRRDWVVPEWWKKRWPVDWHHEEVTVEAMYPDFKQQVQGHKLVLAITDTRSWNEPFSDEWQP